MVISKQLVIEVKGDFIFVCLCWEEVSVRNWQNVQVFVIGKWVLMEYCGEIFMIFKENGIWRNFMNSLGEVDCYFVWLLKGDQIVWFLDKNGEYELQFVDQ